MSIWKDNKRLDTNEDLFLKVQDFFDHIQDSQYLQYRDGQRNMAYSVVDAIENKQILLIEAGVGIGKSYAYLIPLIQQIKDNRKFEGVIIATSTIALQEQLMNDVRKVAEMLGLDSIDVVLAKGKNNYICRERLNDFLKTTGNEKYRYILDEVLKKESIDRKDFEGISRKIWESFNVQVCSNMECPYYANCKITHERPNYKNAKIIITNQDLLIQDLKKDEDERLFKGNRTVVIDEAHNLEDKIRNSYVLTLDKRYIESLLYRLYFSVSDYTENYLPSEKLIDDIKALFSCLKGNAKNELHKFDSTFKNYSDCSRVGFCYNTQLEEAIKKLITSINKSLIEIENKRIRGNYRLDKKALKELKCVMEILKDMMNKEKSKNLYWVDFLDSKGKNISLSYSPKKVDEISSRLLSQIHAGVVLTSATLSSGKDDYHYYSNSIGLDKISHKPVVKEYPQISPYNYDENTILYCPKDIKTPRNKNKYLQDIIERIQTLMGETNGRTLVLFTSKSDMNYVYDHIDKSQFDFPIYIQKDNANMDALKNRFTANISSCLFATGSFYEGVDIKGESLSQVIIAKLPFPVVDPVVDYKASMYNEGLLQVYLPEMITKLKQGTGRAIRSETDTAVISILDSRIHEYNLKYDNLIFESLPYTNITDDIGEVRSFVSKKINRRRYLWNDYKK